MEANWGGNTETTCKDGCCLTGRSGEPAQRQLFCGPRFLRLRNNELLGIYEYETERQATHTVLGLFAPRENRP